MEFYSEKKIKSAKKSHICHICGEVILAGETYFAECGMYNGNFFSRCTCPFCRTIRDKYNVEVDNIYDSEDINYFVCDEVCSKCKKYAEDDCDLGWKECDVVKNHFMQEED